MYILMYVVKLYTYLVYTTVTITIERRLFSFNMYQVPGTRCERVFLFSYWTIIYLVLLILIVVLIVYVGYRGPLESRLHLYI